MHWDAPDGKICIGKPDDTLPPSYEFQIVRSGRGNNVLDARRTEDYEQIPTSMAAYGQGGGRDYTRARVSGRVTDATLSNLDQALPRPTMVIDESIVTTAQAEARARREMAQRCLNRDSWDLTLPGWTERIDGASTGVPYSPDTTATIRVDTVGPASGRYYIWRVSHRGSVSEHHTTTITAVQQGVWVI
jgi:prophage tail gpP-like protein